MANRERNVAEEGSEMIRVGHVYKEDNGNAEVIPFHVDFGSSTVLFAPVGSGREDRMRTSDFLNRYSYQGVYSSLAEEQTEKDAPAPASESTARRVSRDAGTVEPSVKPVRTTDKTDKEA